VAIGLADAPYLHRNPMGFADASSFTMCWWFWCDPGMTRTYNNLVAQWAACGVSIFNSSGYKLNFGDSGTDTTGSAISLSTWYHCAWVSNGDNNTVYLNGVSDITKSTTDWAERFSVGTYVSNSDFFDGRIAHFKAWDGVQLSVEEIVQEMRSVRPRRTANLFLWSHFMASTSADNSGNGNAWTVVGSPTIEDGPPVGWGAAPHVVNPTVAVALYVTWGEAAPDADEQDLSWSLWQTAPATPVNVGGNADYGQLAAVSGESCYSSVVDALDTTNKTFTVTKEKYGTSGAGNVTIYIRGSDTSFAQHDGTPSWSIYTTPVAGAWRYVQLKIVYAA